MAVRKRQSVDATETTRLNLHVPLAVQQRLMVASVMTRQAPGAIIAELIETHLKEFRVQRIQANSASTTNRVSESESVNESAPCAA